MIGWRSLSTQAGSEWVARERLRSVERPPAGAQATGGGGGQSAPGTLALRHRETV